VRSGADLVADPQAAAHGGADLLDDAGDVPAGHDRQVVGEGALEVALAHLPVDRVDARGPRAHQHDVGADGRVVDVADLEDLGSAEAVVDGCAHGTLLGGGGQVPVSSTYPQDRGGFTSSEVAPTVGP